MISEESISILKEMSEARGWLRLGKAYESADNIKRDLLSVGVVVKDEGSDRSVYTLGPHQWTVKFYKRADVKKEIS